jgi:hypothetical protein
VILLVILRNKSLQSYKTAYTNNTIAMADVDMPDADTSSGPSKGKVAGKSAKITVPETGGDEKKRFEVKKVLLA